MSTPLKLFCCSAREDWEMLEHLKKHLMPLQRRGQIVVWSDTALLAGVEREKELHRHLENADIILLLISPDFINSDYCYSIEMEHAIERHEQGSARVIPILFRSTFWQNTPFAKLQMLPTNTKPIKSWPDMDEAFHDVTEQIYRVISEHYIQRIQTEANEHAQAGRYQEALACYECILRLDSANNSALSGRANMLTRLRKDDANAKILSPTKPGEDAARDVAKTSLGTSVTPEIQRERRTRQEERIMYNKPPASNQGNIRITAPITGRIVNIGHDGYINASQNTPAPLDRAALKANLQELFGALGSANLPIQVQMEAQTATGLANQQVEEPALHVDALAQHFQRIGQSLQRANVTVEEGSRLATAIIKLAHLFGPVVGGTQVVAKWFGIHLP
jgi:tetratricopeptide (TPR) repeat protein